MGYLGGVWCNAPEQLSWLLNLKVQFLGGLSLHLTYCRSARQFMIGNLGTSFWNFLSNLDTGHLKTCQDLLWPFLTFIHFFMAPGLSIFQKMGVFRKSKISLMVCQVSHIQFWAKVGR